MNGVLTPQFFLCAHCAAMQALHYLSQVAETDEGALRAFEHLDAAARGYLKSA